MFVAKELLNLLTLGVRPLHDGGVGWLSQARLARRPLDRGQRRSVGAELGRGALPQRGHDQVTMGWAVG